MAKQLEKLDKNLSGVRAMRKLPGLVIVVDPNKEHIAVAEAKKLGIPVMALVDTNCDPDPIDYIIACNDDALKSVKLIVQTLANAVVEKKNELRVASGKKDDSEEKPEDGFAGEKDEDSHEGLEAEEKASISEEAE